MTNKMFPWMAMQAALFLVVSALPGWSNTWTGRGTSSCASEVANWSGGVPTSSDSIVLDSTTSKDLIWDAGSNGLPDSVAVWTQVSDYTGIVTFLTLYGSTGFTHFTITGNCIISNGTWTHLENSDSEINRLRVTVGGNFILGSGASLNVQGKGYAAGEGPGAGGRSAQNGLPAASHGGMGNAAVCQTYGSLVSPTELGSGAYSAGGGAIWLTVNGAAMIEGTIDARAAQPSLAGGSGGSILLEARSLTGSTNGLLDVSVPSSGTGIGNKGGGGGRIAVILTGSSSLGGVRLCAFGGPTSQSFHHGAAGTIYWQTSTQKAGTGTLVIDNGNRVTPAQTLMTPTDFDLNTLTSIVITNKGVLGLNTNTLLNLGHSVNLVTFGPTESFVGTPQTGGLSIPADWTVSGYALRLYTNLDIRNNLTVSNATLELYAGWQTNVQVRGNLRVAEKGTISHAPNGSHETYRLAMQVDGDLIVAAGGAIDVTGKGYGNSQGPGRGYGSNHNNLPGASHGGRAAEHPEMGATYGAFAPYWVTYGSITTPTNLGSGAIAAGGGAVLIDVKGTTRLEGAIRAQGYPSDLAGNAGGSIFLTTGVLAGNGVMDASANATDQYGGGGGRIAVILTNGASFDRVTMRAFGAGRIRGAAGTIYRETANQGSGHGVVTVTGDAAPASTNTLTRIPAAAEAPADEIDRLKYVTLMASNHAFVGLTTHLTLGDLYLPDDSSCLRLNGNTLTLKADYHADWGAMHRVIYDGGQILWTRPAETLYKIQ